jgi:hypothetical protein
MHLRSNPGGHEASSSGVPELRTFAAGIKRDQAAVLAALTNAWREATSRRAGSPSQVALPDTPMDVLDLICYDIECSLAVHEFCTEDDGEPISGVHSTHRTDLSPPLLQQISPFSSLQHGGPLYRILTARSPMHLPLRLHI